MVQSLQTLLADLSAASALIILCYGNRASTERQRLSTHSAQHVGACTCTASVGTL